MIASDDCIRRSELIMHLSDWAFSEAPLQDDHDQNIVYDTIQTCIQAVERMPSADVVSREDYEGLELVCQNYEEALKDAVDELEESDHNVVEIKKEGEWDMFDLISSAYYGKGMYFKQDNGTVYSRHSGDYMTIDEAIREFISLIDEENIAFVPSVTTAWADGEAPTYVLQKRGKWIFDEGEFVCSECDGIMVRNVYNFCPWCGADMREGDLNG